MKKKLSIKSLCFPIQICINFDLNSHPFCRICEIEKTQVMCEKKIFISVSYKKFVSFEQLSKLDSLSIDNPIHGVCNTKLPTVLIRKSKTYEMLNTMLQLTNKVFRINQFKGNFNIIFFDDSSVLGENVLVLILSS